MKATKQQTRQAFRDSVFKRDGHRCRVCRKPHETLDAHHITDRHEIVNGGYVKENGITLCPEHHLMAEEYHSTGKTHWYEGFHPDDLYKLIQSSFELAIQAAERLNLSR